MRSRSLAPLLALAALATPAGAQPTGDVARPPAELEQKVSFSFQETSLELVVAAIQQQIQVNLVVDPRLLNKNLSVTAQVSDEPLVKLLDEVQGSLAVRTRTDKTRRVKTGVERGPDGRLRDVWKDVPVFEERKVSTQRVLWCGAVYVLPAGKKPLAGEPPAPKDRNLLRPISVRFEDTPLPEALARIKGASGVTCVIPARVRGHLGRVGNSVTLRLWQVPTYQVLTHVGLALGLRWAQDGNEVSFDVLERGPEADVGAGELTHFDAKAGKTWTVADAIPEVQVQRLVRGLALATSRRSAIEELIRNGSRLKAAAAAATGAEKQGAAAKLQETTRLIAQLLAQADVDAPTTVAALEVARGIGEPRLTEPVLAVFKDAGRDLDVRRAAATALGSMKAVGAIPSLIDALDDNWLTVAETARQALVEIGEPAVDPVHEVYLKHAAAQRGAREQLVFRGLLILGEIGTKKAKAILLRALETRSGPRSLAIRHHAAIGLGYTNDPALIQPLIVALERERDSLIKKYITRSLTWITGEGFEATETPWKVWWEMTGRAKYQDTRTAQNVLEDFGGELKPKLNQAGMIDMSKDGEAEPIEARVGRLLKDLGSSNARDPKALEEAKKARRAAAKDLEAMGKHALPALEKAASESRDGTLQTWARYVIRRIEANLARNP